MRRLLLVIFAAVVLILMLVTWLVAPDVFASIRGAWIALGAALLAAAAFLGGLAQWLKDGSAVFGRRTEPLPEPLPEPQEPTPVVKFEAPVTFEGDQVAGPKTEIHHHYASGAERLPLEKPEFPTHFTGREAELNRLLDDLQPGRVVTLCGPGGIGKSALAAAAIWRLAPSNTPPERFPDGILVHTFYNQPQAKLALENIARLFGEDPRPSPLEAARRALAGRRALLLLDGAEACDNLPEVLSVHGNCCALVTTRRHSDAAASFQDIFPLPADEAVSLLCAWAGTVEETIAREICALCGRLPLALRLAGSYLAATGESPVDYLDWLRRSPLQALDLGERQAESVPLLLQRSLAQVSETACQALSIVGALALAPFPLESAQAALEMDAHALRRALGMLVDNGLLLRSGETWQASHALVHAYVRQFTPPGAETVRRLGGFYAALAEIECQAGLEGYRRLDAARPHLLAAAEACQRLGQPASVRRLAWAAQDYLDLQGHWSQRRSLIEMALQAARDEGEKYDEGAFSGLLGLAYAALGDAHKAIEYHEQALVISREIGDRRGEGNQLWNLGLAYETLGEAAKARPLWEQALSIYRAIEDPNAEMVARKIAGLDAQK